MVKEVLLVKSLLTARDILLEEAQKLGKATDQSIDFTEFIAQMDDTKLFDSLSQADVSSTASDAKKLEVANSQRSSEVRAITK